MKAKITEAVLVEGRYDKNKLSQILDTLIVESGGFAIFKDRDKLAFLRKLAGERGLIILTDSDGAGALIRNYLKSALTGFGEVRQAYIPEICGKEKRKTKAGKEGILGVEGMSREILLTALHRAGATFCDELPDCAKGEGKETISAADLYSMGLAGTEGARERREKLLRKLNFPSNLNKGDLLRILNQMPMEEVKRICSEPFA